MLQIFNVDRRCQAKQGNNRTTMTYLRLVLEVTILPHLVRQRPRCLEKIGDIEKLPIKVMALPTQVSLKQVGYGFFLGWSFIYIFIIVKE